MGSIPTIGREIANMERNLDSSRRPFPLLKLPLEVRHMIFRYLLYIPYTFYDNEYHMHPEILLVSKQISAEAEKVLDENYFVVLELDRKDRDATDWFSAPQAVPLIHNLSAREESFVAPVLWIRLQEDLTGDESKEEMEAKDNDTVCHLMGPEAIPHLIDLFWDNAILHNQNQHSILPLSSTTMVLTLTTELFPHKQKEIEELLLAPFQLVMFGDIELLISTVTNANTSTPPMQMNAFPTSANVKRMMRHLMKKGQKSYDAGMYLEACHWWYRLERYRLWIATIVTSHELAGSLPAVHWPLVRRLRRTFPLLLQAFLGEIKALLHIRNWVPAYNLAMNASTYASTFFGTRNIYYAKFMLCISMARDGQEDATFPPRTKRQWLDDLLERIPALMRETQYAVLLPRVLKEHFWAMATFPAQSQNYRYFSTRKFWDILEVTDSSKLPTTNMLWQSRRDAGRELWYNSTLRQVTRAKYGF